jgi:hypothetical protein
MIDGVDHEIDIMIGMIGIVEITKREEEMIEGVYQEIDIMIGIVEITKREE